MNLQNRRSYRETYAIFYGGQTRFHRSGVSRHVLPAREERPHGHVSHLLQILPMGNLTIRRQFLRYPHEIGMTFFCPFSMTRTVPRSPKRFPSASADLSWIPVLSEMLRTLIFFATPT